MNEQKTGGSAFPWCGDLNDCPTINLGMTLRDYFAAKAMQAIITNDEMVKRMDRMPCYAGVPAGDGIAIEAYRVADAMLAERAK